MAFSRHMERWNHHGIWPGRIVMTAATIDSTFSGQYFSGVPLTLAVEANFIPTPLVPQMVINEINYHSNPHFNPGNWVASPSLPVPSSRPTAPSTRISY